MGFLPLGKQGAVLSGEVSGEVCGEMFGKHLTTQNPLRQRGSGHFGEVSGTFALT